MEGAVIVTLTSRGREAYTPYDGVETVSPYAAQARDRVVERAAQPGVPIGRGRRLSVRLVRRMTPA